MAFYYTQIQRRKCLYIKNIVQMYDIFVVETRGFEPLAF